MCKFFKSLLPERCSLVGQNLRPGCCRDSHTDTIIARVPSTVTHEPPCCPVSYYHPLFFTVSSYPCGSWGPLTFIFCNKMSLVLESLSTHTKFCPLLSNPVANSWSAQHLGMLNCRWSKRYMYNITFAIVRLAILRVDVSVFHFFFTFPQLKGPNTSLLSLHLLISCPTDQLTCLLSIWKCFRFFQIQAQQHELIGHKAVISGGVHPQLEGMHFGISSNSSWKGFSATLSQEFKKRVKAEMKSNCKIQHFGWILHLRSQYYIINGYNPPIDSWDFPWELLREMDKSAQDKGYSFGVLK